MFRKIKQFLKKENKAEKLYSFDTTLPGELICKEIGKYLTFKDIQNLAQVSHTMYKVISDNPTIFSSMLLPNRSYYGLYPNICLIVCVDSSVPSDVKRPVSPPKSEIFIGTYAKTREAIIKMTEESCVVKRKEEKIRKLKNKIHQIEGRMNQLTKTEGGNLIANFFLLEERSKKLKLKSDQLGEEIHEKVYSIASFRFNRNF